MLTGILLVIGGFGAGLLFFAAKSSSRFRIERSIRIDAGVQSVFPWLNEPRNAERWLPFARKDPQMKHDYSGPARGVGAVCTFAGGKQSGTGRITITESTAPVQVVSRLEMFSPFKADNRVVYTAVPLGDRTEVHWSMEGKSPFIARLMCAFFDMDSMVGKDFEDGLINLKSLVERGALP
ncbi:MAG: SRPBCC family protein [Pseudomonadota bacterium]